MERDASIILKLRMEDKATREAKEASEKIQAFLKGAAENARDSFVKSLDVVGSGLVTIVGEVKKLEKAFGLSFFTINDEFLKLSDSIFSETQNLIKGIDKFPRVFSAGFAAHLTHIRKESLDNFVSISAFGKTTAIDLNKAFSDNFFNAFKGHTASMSGMWASFAETMKNNFLKALADMASAYVTSTIFQAFSGGLNILGFSGGGMITKSMVPSGDTGVFGGNPGELVVNTLSRKGITDGISILADKLGSTGGVFVGSQPTFANTAMQQAAHEKFPTSFEAPSALAKTSEWFKGATAWFKETFPGFSAPGAGLGALSGGLAAQLLSSQLFPQSTASSIGGMMGSAAGSALAAFLATNPATAPFAILGGAFLGGLGGSGIGSLFGGERLNADEKNVGTIFKQLQDSNQFAAKGLPDAASHFLQDMALARMAVPDAGADSVHDSFKEIAGRMINASDVDGGTIVGLKWLVENGVMTRDQIDAKLVKDLAIFKGRFASGLDFVPYDNFPALLHYGERVLTQSENRRMSDSSAASGIFVDMLAAMKEMVSQNMDIQRSLDRGFEKVQTMLDRVNLNIKIVTVDMDQLAEYAIKVFNSRLRSGEITIDARSVTGLKSDMRL